MKINVNGKEVEAVEVGFTTFNEPFIEYILEDGNTARVKFVMFRILATNERDPATNEPIYSFFFKAVASVTEKQKDAAAN